MSVEQQINGWIQTAHERGASDIHFEPEKGDRLRVRMRVDGLLSHMETVGTGRQVLARIKVMAGMDVNERALPLDGRISFGDHGGTQSLDLRVSTTPCLGGEKAVLRLIDNKKLGLTLEDLGFTPRMLAAYRPLITSPHGLLLHVGPTGSGKTTSLYAILKTLHRTEVNIQTVEDPVEYDVNGITQTQVDAAQGLTFPRILRALLRQDPNIIMVGEIRDAETAEIATEAAMTGHLVLSTLHTNDAVGTIVRLLDMEIAPYCIAYALKCVVSQRFVRKLCTKCKRSVEPSEQVRQLTKSDRPTWEAEGCSSCFRSGYKGRLPVFEFLPMTPALRQAIYSGATPDQIQTVAQQNGLITLWQDGVEKLMTGATSVEEVLRVVKGVRDPKKALRVARPRVAARGPAPRRPAGPPRR